MTSLTEAIALAEAELSHISMDEIQASTAVTWAARAIVAYQRYVDYGIGKWRLDACEYHHEALEHAAVASPGVLEMLRPALSDAARAAGVEK